MERKILILCSCSSGFMPTSYQTEDKWQCSSFNRFNDSGKKPDSRLQRFHL